MFGNPDDDGEGIVSDKEKLVKILESMVSYRNILQQDKVECGRDNHRDIAQRVNVLERHTQKDVFAHLKF